MSPEPALLYRISESKIQKRIVLLLDEKGALSGTELMENLELHVMGLLSIHLRALGDLIAKDEAGKYALTEKGKHASQLLTEFPNGSKSWLKEKPKFWKTPYMAIMIIGIATGIILALLRIVSLQSAIVGIATAVFAPGIGYLGRARPSVKFNRTMYIIGGAGVIGGILWLVMFDMLRAMYQRAGENLALVVLSLIVCYGIGAAIGEFIGWLRDYKGPPQDYY